MTACSDLLHCLVIRNSILWTVFVEENELSLKRPSQSSLQRQCPSLCIPWICKALTTTSSPRNGNFAQNWELWVSEDPKTLGSKIKDLSNLCSRGNSVAKCYSRLLCLLVPPTIFETVECQLNLLGNFIKVIQPFLE